MKAKPRKSFLTIQERSATSALATEGGEEKEAKQESSASLEPSCSSTQSPASFQHLETK